MIGVTIGFVLRSMMYMAIVLSWLIETSEMNGHTRLLH